MPGPQDLFDPGTGGGMTSAHIPAIQKLLDAAAKQRQKQTAVDMEGQHAQEEATSRLFLDLLKGELSAGEEAAAAQQKAQADAAGAGPFQVQIEPGSPLAQRPVSFDKTLSQTPSSFDSLLLAAGGPGGLQRNAQANAPGGAAAPQGPLPQAAQGLPVAGPTQQSQQTNVGLQSQIVEDPFRFLTLARPEFSQITTQTPNALGAKDVADLRVQEAVAAEQKRQADRAAGQADRGATLEEAKARGAYGTDQTRVGLEKQRVGLERDRVAIERANAATERIKVQALMRVAQAKARASGVAFTPGEKALDEEYGKNIYSKQVTGGLSSAASDIDSLKGIVLELAQAGGPQQPNLTGPYTGALPNMMLGVTNPPAADLKNRLEAVLQKSAKTVLDSQYAAHELSDYISRIASTQQEEPVVIDRLIPLIQRMEFDLSESERKAAHFRDRGSLRGFVPNPTPEGLTDKALKAAGPTPTGPRPVSESSSEDLNAELAKIEEAKRAGSR